jgi:hypothetical protein
LEQGKTTLPKDKLFLACSPCVQIYIKFGARESICFNCLKELYSTDFRPLFADSA